jgi:hypothetical protein
MQSQTEGLTVGTFGIDLKSLFSVEGEGFETTKPNAVEGIT